MVYLLMFSVVAFIAYLLDRAYKQGNTSRKDCLLRFVLCAMVVLIPVLVAGLRATDVGADTSGYALNDFKKAMDSDDYFTLQSQSNEEPGFMLVAFLTAKLTGNFSVFLAVIEIIIMVFVMKFAIDRRGEIPIWMTILAYLLLCYGESLSVMRQHMALAILLFSLRYLDSGNFLKLGLLWIIAVMFHRSALLFLVVYAIYGVIRSKKMTTARKKRIWLFIVGIICLGALLIKPITQFLVQIGIAPDRYLMYFNMPKFLGEGFHVTFRLLCKVICILFFIILARLQKNDRDKLFVIGGLGLLIIDAVIYSVSSKYTVISRASYYMVYPVVLCCLPLFGTVADSFGLHKKRDLAKIRALVYVSFYFILVGVFWFTNIYNSGKDGGYRIYPYKTILSAKQVESVAKTGIIGTSELNKCGISIRS